MKKQGYSMKSLIRNILLTLFLLQSIEALPLNIKMPPQIAQQLCQKLSNQPCNRELQLEYDHYFKLDNDRLLLFFHTFKPNALYPKGSLNVPVIVNLKGQWSVVNSYIKDEIQEVVYDPHNGIWLHTMSTRKEGYSSLYYSGNGGKQWKKLKLPSIRTFQTLQLCFQEKDVILTFQRVENDNVKAWITSYKDALSDEPSWRLMEKKDLYQKVCQKTTAYNNAWRAKKQQNHILFKHKYKNRTISFAKRIVLTTRGTRREPTVVNRIVTPPKVIPTPQVQSKPIPRGTQQSTNQPYTIQLGTFNYKTSLPLIYKEFERQKSMLITKTFKKIDNRVQYKVYIGTFNDILEAQVKLGELRSEYTNSKILKNAFITKLP